MNRYLSGRLFRLALATLIVLALCAGCHRRKPGPPTRRQLPAIEEPAKERVEAEFKGARIIWRDEQGRKVWEAGFKKAVASQEGETAEVKLLGVKASLYSRGKAVSTLVAPRVTANSRTKVIVASGGVKIVSRTDQASAFAQRVTWNAHEDKLVGEGGVRLTRGNVRARARSLVSDAALGKTTLSGDAEISL